MRITENTIFLVLIMSVLAGCADMPGRDTTIDSDVYIEPLRSSTQVQVVKNEREEQYLEALDFWRHAEGAVKRKITSISEQLEEISKDHSQRGVVNFWEKKGDIAFREFIEALRFDPFNIVALDYLQNRYETGRFVLYTVKDTDTFAKIAETVYGSFTYEFVVAHFSDAGREKDLTPGSMIRLAVLDSFYSQALLDYSKDIRVARKLFKAEKYEEVLPVAETILGKHPKDSEASYIVNMSLLKIAENQQTQRRFEEAIETLSRVDPSFKNVKKMIRKIRELQEEKVSKDSLLANSELFKKGEKLYGEKRYLEARESFLQVDSQYDGLEQAIVNVNKELGIQAESHFKDGVKLFVEENLAAAITEWEKTLQFDPDHLNALKSIVKARKLLEKMKEIK